MSIEYSSDEMEPWQGIVGLWRLVAAKPLPPKSKFPPPKLRTHIFEIPSVGLPIAVSLLSRL